MFILQLLDYQDEAERLLKEDTMKNCLDFYIRQVTVRIFDLPDMDQTYYSLKDLKSSISNVDEDSNENEVLKVKMVIGDYPINMLKSFPFSR